MHGRRFSIFFKAVLLAVIAMLVVFMMFSGNLAVRQRRDADLYAAIRKSDPAAVKLLLSEHADPNVRAPVKLSWMFWRKHTNDFRATALRCAVEQAIFNSNRSTPGTTPAAQEQAIVMALLDAGAHAAPNDGGQKLLEWTLANGSNHLTLATESLLKHGAPLPSTLSGQPLLAGAINWQAPLSTIDALLRAGADAKGAAGRAAMQAAYRQWDLSYTHQEVLSIFRSLLAAGADPNTPVDPRQSTMLYHALQWNHPEIVSLLLQAHANPNLASPNDVVPLLDVALDSTPEVFKELLDAGANPNAHESNGEPVLWYAVIHKGSKNPQDNVRKVELLLAHGANVHTRWDNGNSMTVQEAAHRDAAGYHIDPAILALLDRAAAGTKLPR